MRLSQFVLMNLQPILAEWTAFARTLSPSKDDLAIARLGDDAELIIRAIIDEMETPVITAERSSAVSDAQPARLADGETPAQHHGAYRLREGFTLIQTVSEYQALRTTVLRLWSLTAMSRDAETFEQVIRFNEAIDQSLGQCIASYTAALDRAKDLFLGVLGHDLRNPLNSVVMSAHFLSQSESQDPRRLIAASRIMNSARRMHQMISDILDYTRIRLHTRLPIAPTITDLGRVCLETVDEMESIYPDRKFLVQVSDRLCGRWDAARLGQLISNLVANAVQYGHYDTPVTVGARGEMDEVVLTVHNYGAAIPSGDLRRIFDPLIRSHQQHAVSQEGANSLGLGLYIAREIAETHGGTIEVTSSATDGTTFTTRLPRQVPTTWTCQSLGMN